MKLTLDILEVSSYSDIHIRLLPRRNLGRGTLANFRPLDIGLYNSSGKGFLYRYGHYIGGNGEFYIRDKDGYMIGASHSFAANSRCFSIDGFIFAP